MSSIEQTIFVPQVYSLFQRLKIRYIKNAIEKTSYDIISPIKVTKVNYHHLSTIPIIYLLLEINCAFFSSLYFYFLYKLSIISCTMILCLNTGTNYICFCLYINCPHIQFTYWNFKIVYIATVDID